MILLYTTHPALIALLAFTAGFFFHGAVAAYGRALSLRRAPRVAPAAEVCGLSDTAHLSHSGNGQHD